jgi:cell division protease FtsH
MPFLGRDISDHKDYSEQTAVEIDSEVRRIVTINYERAHKLVVEHMDKLKLLAEALLEFEIIEGNEIDQLFAGKVLQRPPSATAEKRRADAAAKAAKVERPPLFPRPLGDPEKA